MKYITPYEEQVTLLQSKLKKFEGILEKSSLERDFLIRQICLTEETNRALNLRVQALKHKIYCLLILVAGLLITTSAILSGGAA